MPIRMTGLTSGLDTESIVNQLMSAQRTKQTKVENKKQKLEWKQEIWKGLNTKIYGFYKDSLSKMKYSSNYSTKKASVSDSTKLTAITGAADENPALFFCSGKRGWKFVRWTALRPPSYKIYDKAY